MTDIGQGQLALRDNGKWQSMFIVITWSGDHVHVIIVCWDMSIVLRLCKWADQLTMGNETDNVEWQTMWNDTLGDNRQWWMSYTGEWQIMGNDRLWEYQLNDDDMQWEMTDQWNYRQCRITYNGNDREWVVKDNWEL